MFNLQQLVSTFNFSVQALQLVTNTEPKENRMGTTEFGVSRVKFVVI